MATVKKLLRAIQDSFDRETLRLIQLRKLQEAVT